MAFYALSKVVPAGLRPGGSGSAANASKAAANATASQSNAAAGSSTSPGAAPSGSGSHAAAQTGGATGSGASASACDAQGGRGEDKTKTKSGQQIAGRADEGKVGKGAGKTRQVACAPMPLASQAPSRFEIDQYAVEGADSLPEIDVEAAVYPYLGPGRTARDVEKARAALEKSYHDKGYQTVSVALPQQNPQDGIVILKVTELKVGRLRVKNAHYFDIDKIKQRAASLREGTLPDFNAVTSDIVALNQWPDRRVTPALRAGITPGTVDVDLNVNDSAPMHGSLEINDRQSPGTSLLRITGTAHYDDLWQIGHSLTFTYQVAPERVSDAQAFSGSYLARIPGVEWLSFLLYGVYSQSDVAALGGLNVVGPGQIAGIRAVMTLPSRGNFYHTISIGPDYKHFDQTEELNGTGNNTPVTYLPLTAAYSATYQEDKALTQGDVSLVAGLRGVGSDRDEFDNKRFNAQTNFFILKADLSRTQDLPQGFQLYGKVQAQATDEPLVSSEEFSLGGFDTVRGYLESEELGDDGAAGTLELRSPDVAPKLRKILTDADGHPAFDSWRFFGFVDGGVATLQAPLPEQQARFVEWSTGVGTNFQIFTHLNGMLTLALPMISQTDTIAHDPRALFRVWGDF
ncbi:MAG: ShlB/FhaC/HecB family hemolysin secretion/activation protein [Methylovirgula sp.]|uniref:ShlB/FhaC/HecB family hemolysin secretion/activation protein n=1 Tax=Methylovirgula sp. TaxID=1978224 RepID=UPI0030765954